MYQQCRKVRFPDSDSPSHILHIDFILHVSLIRYVEKVAECDMPLAKAAEAAMPGRPVSGSSCVVPQNSVCLHTQGIVLLLSLLDSVRTPS